MTTNTIHSPLQLHPRLAPKPWGGRRLASYGLELPPGVLVGEAWATADEATVATGPHAGRTLAELLAAEPMALAGRLGLAATRGQLHFPLLIKLIDAEQDLSIQVHPNDDLAPPAELGKTEVYHVLAAAPGARIALGLRPDVAPERFAALCEAGQPTTSLLRWIPARPGETILIPAGTIHALGAGCLVYEAQQPSDVTYRLDDWGRFDAAGNPRELHVAAGLQVYDPTLRPEPISPVALASDAGRRQLLAACQRFALERIALAAGEAVPATAVGSAQAITCLRGRVDLETGGGGASIAAGETGVIPAAAAAGRVRADASAVLLRAWVPDLAVEVVGPARRAGHPDAAIIALGGPLPDVAESMNQMTAASG